MDKSYRTALSQILVDCCLTGSLFLCRHRRRDLPAVIAGLTPAYSNGPIEGADAKVKLLKWQVYGRAKFPLLRQRILLAQTNRDHRRRARAKSVVHPSPYCPVDRTDPPATTHQNTERSLSLLPEDQVPVGCMGRSAARAEILADRQFSPLVQRYMRPAELPRVVAWSQ